MKNSIFVFLLAIILIISTVQCEDTGKLKKRHLNQIQKAQSKMLQEVHYVIEKAYKDNDVNGDGTLDVFQFAPVYEAIAEKLGEPKPTAADVNSLFNVLDENEKTQITKKDVINFFEKVAIVKLNFEGKFK